MSLNLSQQFLDYAKKNPNKIAFVSPIEYDQDSIIEEKITTYAEMLQKVANYRQGLIDAGYKKGDRIILLCPINLDFYSFMMACLNLGLVGVFLDPGIGVKKILTTIADSGAKGIVSLDRILKYWILIPTLWKMDKISVDRKRLGVKSLSAYSKNNSTCEFKTQELSPEDHLLITFTSGSTGRSKGADRNAQNVYNQLSLISELWVCDEDQVDFPIFLMFGFLNLFKGITTILPAAKYNAIGDISPKVIASQIRKWKVTRMSGSYTFNQKLVDYLVKKNETIPTIKNIVLGGTPVTKEFCEKLEQAYPNSRNVMTYGSTEVAPISFCDLRELIEQNCAGSFVGKPCESLTVSIVSLPKDISIVFDHQEDEKFKVSQGELGEVIIKGPHVVQSYIENPNADKENKIPTPNGEIWHRTGDTGYFDTEGNLILTGRLNDLVNYNKKVLQTLLIESKIDSVNHVQRSALINKGKEAFLVLQLSNSTIISKELEVLLKELGLEEIEIKYVKSIPLDDRHNSKINRIKLKKMV